jgi:hypothetical protein
MNCFYVYAYLRDDGTPYYIGMGSKYRAYNKQHSVPVPKDKNKIVFLEKNLTITGAIALERRMIEWYGRKHINYTNRPAGILRNQTPGGEICDSDISKRTQTKLVQEGKHHFLKREDGTSVSSDRVKNKTHVFLGPTMNQRLLENNKHPFTQPDFVHCSGSKHGRYDSSLYTFKNKTTGEVVTMTKYDFYTTYNLDQSHVYNVVAGKRKHHKGWVLVNE